MLEASDNALGEKARVFSGEPYTVSFTSKPDGTGFGFYPASAPGIAIFVDSFTEDSRLSEVAQAEDAILEINGVSIKSKNHFSELARQHAPSLKLMLQRTEMKCHGAEALASAIAENNTITSVSDSQQLF